MKIIFIILCSLTLLSSCTDKQSEIAPTPQPPAVVTPVTDGPQGESSEKIDTNTPTNVGTTFDTATTELSSSGEAPSSIR